MPKLAVNKDAICGKIMSSFTNRVGQHYSATVQSIHTTVQYNRTPQSVRIDSRCLESNERETEIARSWNHFSSGTGCTSKHLASS